MAKSVEEVLPPRQPIAIIRLDDLTEVVQICRTLLNGGITILEFTLTNKKALETIAAMRSEFGEQLTIGTGTVLDTENARASIMSGAQFLVTPALLPEVIAVANKEQVPIACGAYTPTEILTAWRLGADLVKVFPAGQLGPGYIKDVLALSPLPAPCPHRRGKPGNLRRLPQSRRLHSSHRQPANQQTHSTKQSLVSPHRPRTPLHSSLLNVRRRHFYACDRCC